MARVQPLTNYPISHAVRRALTVALLSVTLLAGPPTSAAEPLPVDTGVDYQLGGAYPPADGVGIVSRDRHDKPAPGLYSICYVNAFQTQPGTRRWWLSQHPDLVLRSNGKPVVDPDWGEMLLDTRTGRQRRALARIVGRWIDGCAASGFQAVEPDNLDSWQRSMGQLRRRDNLAFSRLLIERAHTAGLAIAQKNAAGLSKRRLFDFAVVEQCHRYRECGRFTRAYADQVIEVEYRRRDFTEACVARGTRIPIVLRDLPLRPAGVPGHRFATCSGRDSA